MNVKKWVVNWKMGIKIRSSIKVYGIYVIKQSYILNLKALWGIKKYVQI